MERGNINTYKTAPDSPSRATLRSRFLGLGNRLWGFFRRPAELKNIAQPPFTLVHNQDPTLVETSVTREAEASPDQKLALEKVAVLGEIGKGIDSLPPDRLIEEFTKSLAAFKQTAFSGEAGDSSGQSKELDALVDMSIDPNRAELDPIFVLTKEFLEKLGNDDLFDSNRRVYRDKAKIELLIAKIRQLKLHKNNVAETQDHAKVLSKGKTYHFKNGLWQEVISEGYEKEATPKPLDFDFLEVDQLPNCKGRERDSTRIVLGSDQIGWAKESKIVSMDKFQLKHLNTDKEEEVNIGISIDARILEYFEQARKVEGFNSENREKLSPMETIFYRDLLNLLSTGRTKRPINPNVSDGVKMYSGSNSGPGDKSFRIYYIDIGYVHNIRSFIIVAGCIKSKQNDLFKYIIRK